MKSISYLSVCSGIEAATVAWHDLGFEPVGFAEVDAFPSAVLRHHYPDVPNLGDMNNHEQWSLPSIDLLVGGTPCQSFSVAGLRGGLKDPRGGLMLRFLEIAQRRRPRWIVWENVPGVLSSNGGRDFGAFLGALGELGYGWAYRILDAQWFGVAQRRRRVFVVGHLGDWQRAAAVLFERESVRRDTPPSRKAGEETAKCLTAGVGKRFDFETETLPVVGALDCRIGAQRAQNAQSGHLIPFEGQTSCSEAVAHPMAYGIDGDQNGSEELIGTLRSHHYEAARVAQPAPIPYSYIQDVSDPITANKSRTYTHEGNTFRLRNVQVVSRPLGVRCFTSQFGDIAESLTARHDSSPCADRGQNVVAFAQNQRNEVRTIDVAGALAAEPGMNQQTYLHQAMQVRRLTPRECERLQGFPDDYTAITYRSKPAADGPRYKALGNSMAVPVMRWIGERIMENQ
jgi:DNA (cytosine-5)-methyltransferase 1